MHLLKSLMHDKLIKGLKTPSVRAMHDILSQQTQSFNCSEVQANYSLLGTLLSKTVEFPDALVNSLGLIDLF